MKKKSRRWGAFVARGKRFALAVGLLTGAWCGGLGVALAAPDDSGTGSASVRKVSEPGLVFVGPAADSWGEVPSFAYLRVEVSDLERSTRFYTQVLGLQEMGPRCMRCGPPSDKWDQKTFGYPESRQPWFQLVHHDNVKKIEVGNGIHGFGFLTTDIVAVGERARAAGYPAAREGSERRPDSRHGVHFVSIGLRDPDGYSIAVAQILRKPNLLLPALDGKAQVPAVLPASTPLARGAARVSAPEPGLVFSGAVPDDWGDVPSFGYMKVETMDLKRAAKFYTDVLGMSVMGPQCSRCGPDNDKWDQITLGYTDAREPWLELNRRDSVKALNQGNPAPALGFITTDLAGVLARARAAGHQIVREALEYRKDNLHMPHWREAVLKDSEGHTLIVSQILEKPNLCLPGKCD